MAKNKAYIIYRYNKNNNDIQFIKEYNNYTEILKDYNIKNYNTLRQYITDSIDKEIKNILNDRYIIIKE